METIQAMPHPATPKTITYRAMPGACKRGRRPNRAWPRILQVHGEGPVILCFAGMYCTEANAGVRAFAIKC